MSSGSAKAPAVGVPIASTPFTKSDLLRGGVRGGTAAGSGLSVGQHSDADKETEEVAEEADSSKKVPEPSVAAIVLAGAGVLLSLNLWRRRRY